MARRKTVEEKPKKQVPTISKKEFAQKCDTWDLYYEKARDTKAAKRFRAQMEAWKKGNFVLVQQFADKAREQTENQEWELEVPPFKDPRAQIRRGEIEIEIDIISYAKDVFSTN